MTARRESTPRRPPLALLHARFPAAVLEVLETLRRAGHRSWIVGGAVRDLLLGRRAAVDHDVATPARPEQVAALFRKTLPTGIAHGTVTVLVGDAPVEVTTFRGEGPYLDGRRPSSVTFLDDLDADLARRDFTVNALAYDPIGEDLRDPFGGRDDLRRGVLRAVGDPAERFREDGLRPLRAARFVAQLGFSVEPRTVEAIPAALDVTARVSAERAGGELGKLAVGGHVLRALELLGRTGLLARVLPALAAAPADEREHAYHACAAAAPEPPLRLAALLHARSRSRPAEEAAEEARSALVALRFPAILCEQASTLVFYHGCVLAPGRPPPPEREAEVRRWLSRVGRPRVGGVLALWRADALSVRPLDRSAVEDRALRAFTARLERVERAHPPIAVGDLALRGRDVMAELGVAGGPVVGEALQHLLARVLEDPGLNDPARLRGELRSWWADRAP